MRAWLAVRALFFVALLPGMVAGYVPFRILRSAGQLALPPITLSAILAALVALGGAGVLFSCVWEFFAAGRGTLAPLDPPRRLVVSGLYRFTRNPMYNGVISLLLGESWFFSSLDLLKYSVVVLAAFHLFIVLYEERTLESRFGDAYRSYRKAVPRWGFTIHPFPETRGTA